MTRGRVQAQRVAPVLDGAADRHARLGSGPQPSPGEQLAFQRGEKALAQHIIAGVADRADRGGTPASRRRPPNASDVCRLPRSA